MQQAQKLCQSIEPNFISFAEYNALYKKSLDVQVDESKKEEMSELHRELVKSNLKGAIASMRSSRKKH